jgi:hypothetical protein
MLLAFLAKICLLKCVRKCWPKLANYKNGPRLCEAGLPDGFFSNPKSQFGKILESLRWEVVDIFYGHLE